MVSTLDSHPVDRGSIPLKYLNIFYLFSCNFTKKIQFDHSKSPKINSKTVRLISLFQAVYVCILWQYGLWSFQTGGTKLERFLPKNQHTQRKLLNFENWVNGEVSKSAKSPNLLTFKVNFLYQKLSESFSIFFSLKNINLGAHFLLLTFFDNINF